jgi:hypothetical protein
MGGGMELDAPPVSPVTAGVGAAGTSPTAVADGVLDGIAVIEAAVVVGGSSAPLPADACCWELDLPAGTVSGGGGMTLEAEGEEALASKGWVKTRRYNNYTRGKKGLHLLGALDLPATLEAGRPLLLLMLLLLWLLLLVPLGEITPRWWWWRRD